MSTEAEMMELLIGEIRSIKETMKKSDENVNQKLDTIQSNLQPVQEKLGTHSKEIKHLKQNVHRRRLIIFGIQGEPREQKVVLEGKILNLFVQQLSLPDFSITEIDFCRRQGSWDAGNKPVMVGLTTERRKDMILKNSKALKGTSISIREDFPPEIREKRKGLLLQMKLLRAQGKFAIVKYDQLITRDVETRGDVPNVGNRQSGLKRALSHSPREAHSKRPNLWDNNSSCGSEAEMEVSDSENQTQANEPSSFPTGNRTVGKKDRVRKTGNLTQSQITDFLGTEEHDEVAKNK